MLNDLFFKFPPYLEPLIADGTLAPVITRAGQMVGLLRHVENGQFVKLAEQAGRTTTSLVSAGSRLPINPLSAALAGVEVVQNFGMMYQMNGIQSALAAMQTTLGWIGAGQVVGITLQAVNIWQTYRLQRAVDVGFARMREGFISLHGRFDQLDGFVTQGFEELFRQQDEEHLRRSAAHFETCLGRIGRAQNSTSQDAGVRQLHEVENDLYKLLAEYEARLARPGLNVPAKARYHGCGVLLRSTLAQVLFLVGERRSAIDILDESAAKTRERLTGWLQEATPYETAVFLLPETEKCERDLAVMRLLRERFAMEEVPSPVLHPEQFRLFDDFSRAAGGDEPAEEYEEHPPRPKFFGLPALPQLTQKPTEGERLPGKHLVSADDYKALKEAFGFEVHRPTFVNVEYLAAHIGCNENSASLNEEGRLSMARSLLAMAAPETRAQLAEYARLLLAPEPHDAWREAEQAVDIGLVKLPDFIPVDRIELTLGGSDYSRLLTLPEITEYAGVAASTAFSPDGRRWAAGCETKSIILGDLVGQWTVQSRPKIPTAGQVLGLAFSPDGAYLAYGDDEGSIGIVDTASLEVALYPDKATKRFGVAFHPQQRVFAVASKDKAALLLSYGNGKPPELQLRLKADDDVNAVAFSSDGRLLAFVDDDGYLHTALFEGPIVANRPPLREQHQISNDWLRAVAFHPRQRLVVCGGDEKIIRVVTVKNGVRTVAQWEVGAKVYSVAFSPCGRYVAAAADEGKSGIWSWEDGHRTLPRFGRSRDGRCVAFRPDGHMVATANDGVVQFWAPFDEP